MTIYRWAVRGRIGVALLGATGGLLTPAAAQQTQRTGASLAQASMRTVRFETTQGTAMNVDVSPDGRTIVFDLLGDLYTVPITGGAATRLTSGPAFDTEPVFSPDGKRIAFVSDRSGSDNVWVMDADGRHARAFTRETTVAVVAPEWVPAPGEFVLIARKEGRYWLYRDDGRGTSLQLGGAGAAWSHDGRFLYTSPVAPCCEGIRRIDVARGNADAVSDSRFPPVSRPAVSPNGQWMVFGVEVDNQIGLRLLNLRTRQGRWLVYPLPEREAGSFRFGRSMRPRFAFTPDGAAIVLATGGTLHRLDVRTGALRPLRFRATVELQLPPRAAAARSLGSEPGLVRTIRDAQHDRTGARTVFTALGRVWMRDGAAPPTPLVEQPGAAPTLQREPALSPDGQRVAYVTWNDAEGGQLWRVSVHGGPPRQLTTRPGVYRHPVWSPDGSLLAVVREDETPRRNQAKRIAGDVYVLPAAGGPLRRVTAIAADDVPSFAADGQALLILARPTATGSARGEARARSPHVAGPPRPALLAHSLATGDVDTVAVLPADVAQVALAPDGERVAYTRGQTVYTARIRPVADWRWVPVTVTEAAGLWPATAVTQPGGMDLRWAADSRTLAWVHDGKLVRREIGRTTAADTLSLVFPWPRSAAGGSVALEGATVITMRGDEVLRDATVVVTGGRIAAVGPRDSIVLPAGVQRIDVAGQTIMPGLIDLWGDVPLARDLLEGTNIPLAANLAFGITTVRTFPAGDDVPEAAFGAAAGYAELLDSGTMTGARLLAGGTVTAAHAAQLTSLDAARALIRRQRAFGVTAMVQRGPLQRRQRQWLATAAREAGLALIGESGDLRHALTMVLDGYHTIQGAIPTAQLYDDVRRLFAAAQTVYIPTLVAPAGGSGPSGTDGASGTAEEYFLEMTDIRQDPRLRPFGLDTAAAVEWRVLDDYHFIPIARQAARLAALDVPVAVGTAGTRPGLGVHWEMGALALGGFSAHDALRAATATAAEALGLGHELGSIEVGKVADLVVLDADPLAELPQSRATRYVMRQGVLFDARTLAQIWPRRTPPPVLRDTRYDPPTVAPPGVARRAGTAEPTR